MPKSSVISVRMKKEILEILNEYSELLNIRPSTLIALIVEDQIEDWVKLKSEEAYKRIWKKT